MRRKTSITLSEDLIVAIDDVAGAASRSAYIERVLRRHFRRRARRAAQARDVEKINATAERLNAEMADVLEFQSSWPDDR